jgi:hypothetical protein
MAFRRLSRKAMAVFLLFANRSVIVPLVAVVGR